MAREEGRTAAAERPRESGAAGRQLNIDTILRDLNWQPEDTGAKRIALLVDEKAGAEKIMEAFAFATRLRDQGNTVTVQPLKKNAKFQVETLEKNGYTAIRKIYADTLLEDGI